MPVVMRGGLGMSSPSHVSCVAASSAPRRALPHCLRRGCGTPLLSSLAWALWVRKQNKKAVTYLHHICWLISANVGLGGDSLFTCGGGSSSHVHIAFSCIGERWNDTKKRRGRERTCCLHHVCIRQGETCGLIVAYLMLFWLSTQKSLF